MLRHPVLIASYTELPVPYDDIPPLPVLFGYCVVLCAMPSAPGLMVRGVLYTALTRARELLILVGDDAAVREMAANDRRARRYSGLRWRLAHSGD